MNAKVHALATQDQFPLPPGYLRVRCGAVVHESRVVEKFDFGDNYRFCERCKANNFKVRKFRARIAFDGAMEGL